MPVKCFTCLCIWHSHFSHRSGHLCTKYAASKSKENWDTQLNQIIWCFLPGMMTEKYSNPTLMTMERENSAEFDECGNWPWATLGFTQRDKEKSRYEGSQITTRHFT